MKEEWQAGQALITGGPGVNARHQPQHQGCCLLRGQGILPDTGAPKAGGAQLSLVPTHPYRPAPLREHALPHPAAQYNPGGKVPPLQGRALIHSQGILEARPGRDLR